MKLIKLAIISVVVLFLITTAMGLLLPSTVRVKRNITIQTPKENLYSYIDSFPKWKLWFDGADSVQMNIISSSPAGKGAVMMMGNQKVEITKATANEIQTTWYGRSKNQLGVFQFYTDSLGSTNINWYFEQKLGFFPWERLPAIASDKIIGPVMERSLDHLKKVAEQ